MAARIRASSLGIIRAVPPPESHDGDSHPGCVATSEEEGEAPPRPVVRGSVKVAFPDAVFSPRPGPWGGTTGGPATPESGPRHSLFARPAVAEAHDKGPSFLRTAYFGLEARAWMALVLVACAALVGSEFLHRETTVRAPRRAAPSSSGAARVALATVPTRVHLIPSLPDGSAAAEVERSAVEALIGGQYVEAIRRYRSLGHQGSSYAAFTTIARLLERKMANRCPGPEEDGVCGRP